MGTGHRNNKSGYKGIRFPNDLVEKIDISVEREKSDNSSANFSAWVLDACQRKLLTPQVPASTDAVATAPGGGILTKQKMKFADYLIKGENQKQAAILAGYSQKTAKVKGCRLAKEPCVMVYIASKQ